MLTKVDELTSLELKHVFHSPSIEAIVKGINEKTGINKRNILPVQVRQVLYSYYGSVMYFCTCPLVQTMLLSARKNFFKENNPLNSSGKGPS